MMTHAQPYLGEYDPGADADVDADRELKVDHGVPALVVDADGLASHHLQGTQGYRTRA